MVWDTAVGDVARGPGPQGPEMDIGGTCHQAWGEPDHTVRGDPGPRGAGKKDLAEIKAIWVHV